MLKASKSQEKKKLKVEKARIVFKNYFPTQNFLFIQTSEQDDRRVMKGRGELM